MSRAGISRETRQAEFLYDFSVFMVSGTYSVSCDICTKKMQQALSGLLFWLMVAGRVEIFRKESYFAYPVDI
jgi:hypothetical protein